MKRRRFLSYCVIGAVLPTISSLEKFIGNEAAWANCYINTKIKKWIPIKTSDINQTVVNGKLILNKKNQGIVLNDVGRRVWENVNGQNSNVETAKLLAHDFNIDLDTALSDVNMFLTGLRNKGFIKAV